MDKHSSTTSLRSQIDSQLSGQQRVKAVQNDQRHKHQQARFWDAQGILFIDYLEKERILHDITGALEGRNRQKTARNEKEKVFFHQDNALRHKLIATMAKLYELHFELLPQPPYSPDLAPSDYWLFADLKRILRGKRLGSNKEVISETKAYFKAKDKSFYKKGIELLEKRWNQCINLEGDNVDE